MKLINPLIILRILSTILLLETISFLICLPVAIIYEEPLFPLLLSAAFTGLLFIILRIITRNEKTTKLSNRDGYVAVTLSWLVFSIMGALPYLISGTIPSFIDAFFESASGFTTTGASILQDIEVLPYSILFWRSFTHWIGGLGIIVLVIIILPSLRITAQQLMGLESSLKEKIHPKTKSVGLRLFFLYLGLTIFEVFFLYLGEMDLFDSLCHTFGTVATGGFSTKNTSIAGFSPYTQYVIAVFMVFSGISFLAYYYMIKLQFNKVKYNEELWFYLGTTLVAVIVIVGILSAKSTGSFETIFREGVFQTISIITTTGYVTANYLLWPRAAIILIFILLFAGANTGSSTSSIKMARHLIVLKNIRNIFTRLIHSNVIIQIKLNGKPVSDKANISVISFVILYLFIFLAGTFVITMTGLDPVSSASGVAATLGNVGPALGSLGPVYNYAHLPDFTKFIFILLMIVGRLEIIAVFALFTKSFWKL
jgi:trk system potassium uptake protein TrkH